MSNFNIGFKALAYPASHLASDSVSACSCSLAFKYDESSKQATLLLVATVPSTAPHNPNDAHTFVLQYDADLLSPGTTRLTSGSTDLPQLDDILRAKGDRRPQIKTLALSFQQTCPVWCPDHPSFAHKPGSELSFRQFTDLAVATDIHIVFDYKYLRKEDRASFKAFSRAAKGLTGYPVSQLLGGHGLRKASWEVFGPVDAAGAPPAYDNPRKRPRQTSSSLNQSPKRLAPQSPTESHTSDKTVPLSPAAAAALSTALGKESSFDYQTSAINAAVNTHLSAHLERLLPTLLPSILPPLLPPLFAAAPPASPLRPRSSTSTSSPPPLPPLTPLAHSLLPHLLTHLRDQFQTFQSHQLTRFQHLLDRLSDAAEGVRAHETAEMMDEMEEMKTDMLLLREDAVKELSREADAVFEKARQVGWDLEEELVGRLEEVFGVVCERLERVERGAVKTVVRREVGRWQRRRREVRRGVGKRMGRGDKRLLGRRREEEELEWVDC